MRRFSRIGVAALLAVLALPLSAQNTGQVLDVSSKGKAYKSYLSAGAGPERKPGIVLIHSFMGFEQGYKDMIDRFAADGFVVLAPGWQTFEEGPSDEVVGQLVKDSIAVLKARGDVDPKRIGLTGFCAGGRYTMLFLPTMDDFAAGVAWYGFPKAGGQTWQPVKPIDIVGQLHHPLLIIHGSSDEWSPIAGIYEYAAALQEARKYFELKVYQGLRHGFMIQGGQLSKSDQAKDAYQEMVTFFKRKLG